MTANNFHLYLVFVASLAAALGVVNLLRPHKRWLGAGAILLSIATMLYAASLPLPVVLVACGLAVACLAKDLGTRMGKPPRKRA